MLGQYKNATGDYNLEKFWCPNSSPEDVRRDLFPTIDFCGVLPNQTEEYTHGTFLHELVLFPIVYDKKICPTFFAALCAGGSLVLYCGQGFMIFILCIFVLVGMSKRLIIPESDAQRRARAAGGMEDALKFPSPSANFREIKTLRAEMNKQADQMAVLRDALQDAGIATFPSETRRWTSGTKTSETYNIVSPVNTY